jgi:iron complex outermembrane recepter protein
MVIRGFTACLSCSLVVLAFVPSAYAASDLSEADFLAEIPTVLTASRLSQPLMDAPNSTTVIDRKQIEASGYHNLADLFRLVPGMYVGFKKGWFHNVTHTFAAEYGRRMQVMVDGRSVYLPSIGGVRWDTLPLSIQDIERIEVVRGPNAASFGANAFTGIINIITRHPDDVAGRMLRLSAGNHDHQEAWFRWAGRAANSSHRITLGERRDNGFDNDNDDENSRMLSYRGEFELGSRENLGLQFGGLWGDRGDGRIRDVLLQPHDLDLESGFFQADYQRQLASGNKLQAKLFFNTLKTQADIPVILPANLGPGTYYESDLLAQRWHAEIELDSVHGDDLRSVMGAYVRLDSVQSLLYYNDTDNLHADSHGLFGHLEWRMANAWLLNTGVFWEDYEMVGGRFSPRATVHWQPSARHSFRFGVSKAYRNPVLFETDADYRIRLLNADGSPISTQLPAFPDVLFPDILASGNVAPESIVSREIGYLGQWPEQDITLDVRLFRERIKNFIDVQCSTGTKGCKTGAPPYRDWYNLDGILQQGYEIQAKWNPAPNSMLMLNHAYLKIDTDIDYQEYSPPKMTGLHWMHRFNDDIDLTLSQYWVSSFTAIDQDRIASYRRLDARLAKSFRLNNMQGQIALTWQNLSGPYMEFHDSPRNVFDRRTNISFQLEF